MQFSFAQEKTVTGIVSDAIGPLAGANVVVQGTMNGATTNFDGAYSIKANQGDVLVFTYTGMTTTTVVVGASDVVNATMEEAILKGGEVEVIGALGIKRKADDVTSSYQVVTSEEISQASNPNVVQSLAGKVSGLQINTGSNSVNSDARIVINGPRSISGNNQALIVIDNAISTTSVLQSLAPEIIESVNVIKGQQGAALYGSQGSNGVIVVTTKKGAKGSDKFSVTLSNSIDFQTVSYLPQRQTRYGQGWYGEHIAYENGAWGAETDPNVIVPVGFNQANGSPIMAQYVGNNDNIKDFFKTGTIMQNGISISAGSMNNGYVNLSINRQDRGFIVEGDTYKRTNFFVSAGKKVGKMTLQSNIQYYNAAQNNALTGQDENGGSVYSNLLQGATTIPISRFANSGNDGRWTAYMANPYWLVQNNRQVQNTDYFNGGLSLNYEFNKHISLVWNPNVQLTSAGTTAWRNAFTPAQDIHSDLFAINRRSAFYDSTSLDRRIYSDILLNFDYDLSESLNFRANIGNNIQDRYYKVNQVGGQDFDVAGLYNFSNVIAPYKSIDLSNFISRTRKFSFFGNFDLNYKKFLNLNITARKDWISTLDGTNRSFFYPSAGLSFIPTKAFESIKGKVVNDLKLYANYTTLGNASTVNPYDINATAMSGTGYPFGNLTGYNVNTNQTYQFIKPERNFTRDFGFSLGMFNNRVTIDAQYYYTQTKDLITGIKPSYTSGLRDVVTNIGELHNTGYNIDLGLNPIKGVNGGFDWTTRFNFSTYQSIVDKVSDQADEVNLQPYNGAGIFAVAGESFPMIKGTGYQRDPQGNVIVDAVSGNPLYTTSLINLGKVNPDYILGFTNKFSYKGLTLTNVLDFRSGGHFYSGTMYQLAWTGNLIESAENGRAGGFIFPNSVINTGTAANPVYTENTSVVTGGSSYTSYQTYFGNDYAFKNNENNVLDATFLKVREIALSYDLPKKMLANTGFDAVSFGVNGRNLFMWLPKTNRYYSDPENNFSTSSNAQGLITPNQYPSFRTYGFNVKLTF
jgi:TonB-linked SusC/RagA family outer membrane protein